MSFYLSKEVMPNDTLRTAFNALAVKTFGFSFEDWYQKGYWSNFNLPYTLFQGNEAVANISVNKLEVLIRGEIHNSIQLGTVMTEKAYRNQGLSREIMEEIKHDWEDRCDFMFLFANKSVLDFYPRFGFEKKQQYQFETKAGKASGACRKLNMDLSCDRQMLRDYYVKTNPFSKIQVIHNDSLLMFYCTSIMKDWIYYTPEYDAVVIAEQDHGRLRCMDVYCDQGKNLLDILASVADADAKTVSLEFTPCDDCGWDVSLIQDDEDTLFVLSKGETVLDNGRLLFPAISHT